eukprot:11037582-Alexandrium_andersonii.AAC.1
MAMRTLRLSALGGSGGRRLENTLLVTRTCICKLDQYWPCNEHDFIALKVWQPASWALLRGAQNLLRKTWPWEMPTTQLPA